MDNTYDMVETGGSLSPLGDDLLVAAARMAEQRIDAVIKIKQMAIKVTNVSDWTDQNGKPYLMASGSEKVANLYSISWKIDEPSCEYEESGHFTYTYRGVFSMMGRSIEVEGSRSSKDPFFKKYNYNDGVKTEKPIADLDKRDIKMSAMTNLLGNGITRILGIRNLTWDDLEKFAGITQNMVKNKINYKKDGETDRKPPVRKSENKSTASNGNAASTAQVRAINTMLSKAAVKGDQRHTFVSSIIGRKVESLNDLTKADASTVIDRLQEKKEDPLPAGVPADCPKNPMACEHSGFADGEAFCGPDGTKCPHQEKTQ